MGNRRFRLSDMLPNAWFYKLNSKHQTHHKVTTNPANTKPHTAAPPSSSSHSSLSSVKPSSPHNHQSPELTRTTHLSEQRKSYYFTRHLADSAAETPRTSARRRRSTRPQGRSHEPQPQPLSSAVSTGCICRATIESFFTKPSIPTETDDVRTSSDDGDRALTPGDAFEDMIPSCNCTADEIDGKPIRTERSSDFDQPNLPPIITKKQQRAAAPVRRYYGNASSSSPGVKLRTNTPKIGYRRGRRRRSSESFAVVKSSRDPGRDFKESMLEMIVENNIRERADLEELLACYLSLNADEYHGLIIAVFKQIWFDLVAAGRSHNML